MDLRQKLAERQSSAINDGWRIKEIAWKPAGELEVIAPRTPLSKFLLAYGLLAFLAGLVIAAAIHIPGGLALAVSGLVSLLLTNLTMAKNTYKHFKPVQARCIDREFRLFEHSNRRLDTSGKFYREFNSDRWVIRLLCEYGPQSRPIQVTPLISSTLAFQSEAACKAYLNTHIKNGECRLWVDPKNPLHTCFHETPAFQMRGNG